MTRMQLLTSASYPAMKRIAGLFYLSLLWLMLASCSEPQQPIENTVSNKAPEIARAVTVAKVELRAMAGTFMASGLLVPREEAAVGSELSGYRVADVLFEEGAVVTRGQALVKLDPQLLLAKIDQAKATVAQVSAVANQAKSEADRVASFDGRGVLSDEQLQLRRSQAQSALANVHVAEAQLNELLIRQQLMVIRAPVSGIILERLVRPGDVASGGGQPMFVIATDSSIELDAEVPEQQLADISVGQSALVTLPAGVTLTGRVRLISPRIDPNTKLGRVRVSLPIDEALRVGGFAQVAFSRSTSPVAAVQEKAIHFEASGPLVIVIDENNRAHRVAVKTSVRAAGYVALEQGPAVGARVALGGGAFLLDGDLVEPVELTVAVTHAQSADSRLVSKP
jgi:HlyD family secretion protein